VITSKVTSKGQITIPKKIRELLDIGKADQLVFIPLEKGKVLLTNKRNPARDVFGMLSHRKLSRPVSVEEMNIAIGKRRGAQEDCK
jgi:antitoxin PrlF